MENQMELIEILNKEVGLTPYESQAYISLIIHGPMSPSDLARKSRIPRPRAYDVLRSLMEKGLLMEQTGKPSIYSAVEPAQGLKKLLVSIEIETLKRIEEKRKSVQTLTRTLSQIHEKSKNLKFERGKVWFTQRDSAFISIYCEAIRTCEKELLVGSRGLQVPEKEILEAVKYALKRGVTVRVVRQITDLWTLEDLEQYKEVIRTGSQVRYLNIKEIPLRFMVFDEKDVIIVLPSESIEALWLKIPPLAKILRDHFEMLWRKGKPMMPVIEEITRKRQTGTTDSS